MGQKARMAIRNGLDKLATTPAFKRVVVAVDVDPF
jgi:hypothetical protein